MKKLALIINCLFIMFLLVSCKVADVSDSSISSETVAVGEQSDPNNSSETGVVNEQSDPDIHSETGSVSEQSDFEIPSDIEVVHPQSDRIYCEDLQQVEDEATIIVRAVAKETLDQKVDTIYDRELKDVPTYGYTKREIEVTQVYNGDVNVGDKLVLLQAYYIWTYSDGYKQLISSTSVKPVVKETEYLMFLRYNEIMEGYSLVGDYQGIYAIPTDEIKTKAEEGILDQSDLDIYYDHEPLHYMFPLYNKVVKKYFN